MNVIHIMLVRQRDYHLSTVLTYISHPLHCITDGFMAAHYTKPHVIIIKQDLK